MSKLLEAAGVSDGPPKVSRLITPGVNDTWPPFGPKGSRQVHPQTGPGDPASITPKQLAKQSAKISAVTQVGVGGAGDGAGTGAGDGATDALFEKRPLAGPPVGLNAFLEAGRALLVSTTKKHRCFEGG